MDANAWLAIRHYVSVTLCIILNFNDSSFESGIWIMLPTRDFLACNAFIKRRVRFPQKIMYRVCPKASSLFYENKIELWLPCLQSS